MIIKKHNSLALHGGKPILNKKLQPYNPIGKDEIAAANKILKTGILSGFVANPGSDFFGGKWTIKLEEEFCKYFGTTYAVSFNSATSGLHAALVAARVSSGDEVIVSSYSMSASATAVIMCGATPIFVDIESETFCLDVNQVKEAISNKTKAIMAVNIFGQPAELKNLRDIANKNGIILIEDNAQAPGAKYRNQLAGTVGHMGVFSLNRHKTMQCGEGGVVLCNREGLVKRLQMVRNHGEVVLPDWPEYLNSEDDDIIGYNYRLTELQSAIALPQLRRLNELNMVRINLANYLNKSLSKFEFINGPVTREGCSHVYYLFPMKYNPDVLGVSRDNFVKAMQAEGMPVSNYSRPLPSLPLYRRRCGNLKYFNSNNFPVVNNLWKHSMVVTSICRPPLDKNVIDIFISSIMKIAENAKFLQ